MIEKRRDSKGRVLHDGESRRKDGFNTFETDGYTGLYSGTVSMSRLIPLW